MRFERITDPSHSMYEKAMVLYHASFPAHEQREPLSQARILGDKDYHFNLIYDESAFVGLLCCWEAMGFLYVEHFCILPKMRNRGCGQAALALLVKQGKPILLEIDPPVDAISLRRKGFYERCGFVGNPYFHVHPPYHSANQGHELVVMSCPAALTQGEYDAFRDYLAHRVMANAFAES